ncbi:MAG TPA: fumarylacetoacetate hydrolase family protein [Casimicrobiaceae bacterium]|jgi:2-keto-4-pentenoate hydratase|nr:fumarylacetoacetate hydrolase family protein [Casimicrobiaceae bacterium]
MQTNERVQAVAARIIRSHQIGEQFDAPAGEAPPSTEEAYVVQDIVARHLWTRAGDAIRAWKTGGPNAQATPIAAPIPQSKLFRSPVVLQSKYFHVIGIEAELAFALAHDLPPRAIPYTETDVAAAISTIHVAIEVCDSRLRNWRDADPMWKLADNQMNGALVVGDGLRDWQSVQPECQTVVLQVDGETCGEATGGHPYGNPLRLLPWLANHCAARCGGLRGGDVVTTGAWIGMHFVEPGTTVVARFRSIGEAQIRFLR